VAAGCTRGGGFCGRALDGTGGICDLMSELPDGGGFFTEGAPPPVTDNVERPPEGEGLGIGLAGAGVTCGGAGLGEEAEACGPLPTARPGVGMESSILM